MCCCCYCIANGVFITSRTAAVALPMAAAAMVTHSSHLVAVAFIANGLFIKSRAVATQHPMADDSPLCRCLMSVPFTYLQD